MPQKLVTTIATLILTSAISAQNNNIVDEVIWMVGDEPILLSDVEEMRISAEMYGERIENPYCVIDRKSVV